MEGTGIVWRLGETGGIHRPELDGIRWNTVEHTGNYLYRTGLGSVSPYSYPCRHVRASDLWCRDGTMSRLPNMPNNRNNGTHTHHMSRNTSMSNLEASKRTLALRKPPVARNNTGNHPGMWRHHEH